MKKTMIWTLAVVFVVSLTLAGVGCKPAAVEEAIEEAIEEVVEEVEEAVEEVEEAVEEAAEPIKIGATCPMMYDWQIYVMNGMKSFEAAHPEIEVEYVDAGDDASLQLSQVEIFIQKGMDAIVITTVDPAAAQPIIDACNDAGVPLISLNRFFEGADVFIGADSLDAGDMMASQCIEMSGGEGKIGHMLGELGIESQIVRKEGFLKKLEEAPGLEVVIEASANWMVDEGLTLMENWLQTKDQTGINIICAQNDDMGLGAGKAIVEAGLREEFNIHAVDGTESGCQAIKDGFMDTTVYQDPVAQGGAALQACIDLVNGVDVPEMQLVPWQEVDKDNVDDFLALYK